ncbi:MAG: hydroxyisourate hydrolase [Gemmatirosa sp.]|nr:hydroxyisourate hydrolase [Gemmatirosa sp.]
MSTISTHVLDTALGRPARGVHVTLDRLGDDSATLGSGETDADGRVRDLLPLGAPMGAGVYRLRFDVGEYFARTGRESFYPEVVVLFRVGAIGAHYHVPLLLSPFGFSTYRGS